MKLSFGILISQRFLSRTGDWSNVDGPNNSIPAMGVPMWCTEVADVAFLIFDS